jgi:hypothetical protein
MAISRGHPRSILKTRQQLKNPEKPGQKARTKAWKEKGQKKNSESRLP